MKRKKNLKTTRVLRQASDIWRQHGCLLAERRECHQCLEQTCLLGRGCWNLDPVYSTGLEIPGQKVRLTSFADWISVWGSRE